MEFCHLNSLIQLLSSVTGLWRIPSVNELLEDWKICKDLSIYIFSSHWCPIFLSGVITIAIETWLVNSQILDPQFFSTSWQELGNLFLQFHFHIVGIISYWTIFSQILMLFFAHRWYNFNIHVTDKWSNREVEGWDLSVSWLVTNGTGPLACLCLFPVAELDKESND